MKPRILLLEDDIVLRDLIASELQRADYEVLRVSKPAQALALLDMTQIDLAIFDGGLPGTDGIALMKEARERGYDGKFIFISARPEQFLPLAKVRNLTSQLGILRVFKKPFLFHTLVEYIDQLAEDEFEELVRLETDDRLTVMAPVRSPQEMLASLQPKEPTKPFSQRLRIDIQKVDPGAPQTPESLPRVKLPVETQLQKLKESYRITLGARLGDLLALVEPGRFREDPDTLQKAIRQTHKLHGTAGTLGFADVSELCGQLEIALVQLKQDPETFTDHDWDGITKELKGLLDAYQQPATT